VSEDEEHHVKNDDEIDGCHKSQVKFEHEFIYYTAQKIFKKIKSQNWVLRFLRFRKPKNIGV